MPERQENVGEALVTAGVAYARRDYDQAVDALHAALSRVKKEKAQEVRTHAE